MDLNFDELKSGTVNDIDISKLAESCAVDLDVEIDHPEILLSIGQHLYKGNYYDTPIMTIGEFSAITAISKSKKGFLKSALIGSFIGGSANILFPNIKTHRVNDDTILDFDTEQGKYYTQRALRRVPEIAGSNYPNYYGFATRHLTASERIQVIDHYIKNQEHYFKTPVKLVSIDGIADLVDNSNDIVMSKEASDYVMKWTYDYNLHVTTVIHKSAATNKPLGHLGTYVMKKAETVIELIIEDDYIRVTNPYSRGYRFDDFSFSVNQDALPYLTDDV